MSDSAFSRSKHLSKIQQYHITENEKVPSQVAATINKHLIVIRVVTYLCNASKILATNGLLSPQVDQFGVILISDESRP